MRKYIPICGAVLVMFICLFPIMLKDENKITISGTQQQWVDVIVSIRMSNIPKVRGDQVEAFILNQYLPQIDSTKK